VREAGTQAARLLGDVDVCLGASGRLRGPRPCAWGHRTFPAQARGLIFLCRVSSRDRVVVVVVVVGVVAMARAGWWEPWE